MASMAVAEPSIDRFVFIVDWDGNDPGIEHAVVLTSADVFNYEEYAGLAYSFDVTELSTAVKPFVLRHLLKRGYDRAFYFDPDIEIFTSLEAVTGPLGAADVVLTPHTMEPIPLDGLLPDEIVLLRAGVYNLGFIGVANTRDGRSMLDWWSERLERFCLNDVASGLFTDQKWIDLVPAMLERVAIVRHRGCNVAYWNLHARRVDPEDPRRLTTGEPLVFYHYSGFDVRRPDRLSKYQTRIVLEDEPGLSSLLQAYASRVMANGFAEWSTTPYGFARFNNNVALDMFSRSLLRDARLSGLSFPDPGDVYAEPSAWRYLNERTVEDVDSTADPPLTRYLYAVWRLRPDLRGAFPQVLGNDRSRYVSWLRQHATKIVDTAYLIEAGLRPARPATTAEIGVNVAGYFRTESGVGEAGRGHVMALNAAGIPTSLVDFSQHAPSRDGDATLALRYGGGAHSVNLVCVNADQVPTFVKESGTGFFEGRYNIGSWWWELPEFPDMWASSFEPFDEIWVGTQFIASAVASKSPVPVVLIPPVVSVGSVRQGCKRDFGLRDDEVVFLFVFDYRSVFARKNPLGAIEAFTRAFRTRKAPVRLVIKSVNGEIDPAALERVVAAAGADPRITVIDGYFSRTGKNELLAACDAYISLHRSEGFGYTVVEAMALGKPVIATGWSGPADYLTVSNSFPVGFELVRLAEGHGPYSVGQTWAEPDLDAAAHAMRTVYDKPQQAALLGERARADIVSRYSATAVAGIVAARLRRIAERFVDPVLA
jgi:glycosyltransferase involved in cell wall biosynthesis